MSDLNEKWKQGLKKTRKGFLERVADVFRKPDQNNAFFWENLEESMIETDMGTDTTFSIIQELREKISLKDPNAQEKLVFLLKDRISEILSGGDLSPGKREHPTVILVVGVNGTGKTTTVGKLAHWFIKNGDRVLLAAADTFRAAAGEQLEIWGKQTGADVVRQCMGADPSAVAFDALNAAVKRKMDVLIVDTAGRLHTKTNLMQELKKMQMVLERKMESAPHETFLVMDATTGQNGLQQARLFTEAIRITGIVLTKLDGTAKGGIVIAIKKELGLPVRWMGIGEGADDLIPFDVRAFVDGLFDS